MEETKKEIAPISQEEFVKQIHESALANRAQVAEDFENGILHLHDFSAGKKFKSIRRAIKRGHVSIWGDLYPHRPFKNIKTYKGSITYAKRRYYEQFTHKKNKVA